MIMFNLYLAYFKLNKEYIDNDNEFQATIDIASWADVGSHDVTISFSWQETISATLENGFTVNESDWKLVSITPNESYRNVQNLFFSQFLENGNTLGKQILGGIRKTACGSAVHSTVLM